MRETEFRIDEQQFDLVNCPACEVVPRLRAYCEVCGGTGQLEQLRLVVLGMDCSGSAKKGT